MGRVQHHQAQARRFLALARSDHNAGDYARSANALARAASHAATAAVVHAHRFKRLTRRRLTNFLLLMAAEGRISNGVVKTFRNIYPLAGRLAEADPRDAQRLSRQAGKRVAALIRSLEAAIAGRPVTGRGRRPPRPPWRPAPMTVSGIIGLPDYRDIAEKYGLVDSPLARRPDPHDFYSRGLTPPPCSCHPIDLTRRGDPSSIELSPLWKRALERTFHTRYPDTIPVRP
jgi:hypothetical protein